MDLITRYLNLTLGRLPNTSYRWSSFVSALNLIVLVRHICCQVGWDMVWSKKNFFDSDRDCGFFQDLYDEEYVAMSTNSRWVEEEEHWRDMAWEERKRTLSLLWNLWCKLFLLPVPLFLFCWCNFGVRTANRIVFNLKLYQVHFLR